jgi:hypothetical protein
MVSLYELPSRSQQDKIGNRTAELHIKIQVK